MSKMTPTGKDTAQFRIEEVGLNSPLLDSVVKLHAASKATLGPFPMGAFEDHARQKLILTAISDDGSVAGYLLYRVAKGPRRASIVHLTVGTQFRDQGVARLLVEHVKEKTRHLLGISLRCRQNYKIDDMWQSFGFTVRASRRGRGADGAILDYWWFDHNHDDLWSLAAARADKIDQVKTVIDACVFFDLTDEKRPYAEDSAVLLADWLQDSVTLCVTPEIFNEIQRASTESEKLRGRQNVDRFLLLKTNDTTVRSLETQLSPLFKGATFANDISDMRQIAHTIANEVPFFVTRDKAMLERSEAIYEAHGVSVLHPTDLVNRCDVLRREVSYRPSRLEGSNWRERLVLAADVDAIVSLFKNSEQKSNAFEDTVRRFLAKPNEWNSTVAADGNTSPTIYIVHSSETSTQLEIPLLRHSDHPLAGTLLRHLIHEIVRDAGSDQHKIIHVTDQVLSDESIAALDELGFVPDSGAWWKISISGLVSRQELARAIQHINVPLSLKERLTGAITVADVTENGAGVMRLEHLFHPAKIESPELPCYIVSIRQSWAEHFFDIPVGGQTLMDLKERLHLGIEGAYYCSANNKHVMAPGRILWYVSGKESMCIKACSHLEERLIDTPKHVFSRFRHLGVYSWKHVLETVQGNLDDLLMAFRFSKTERFRRPVTLAELKGMKIPQPQNPRQISSDQFAAIYKLGMQL